MFECLVPDRWNCLGRIKGVALLEEVCPGDGGGQA